jgi:hypothetical protein
MDIWEKMAPQGGKEHRNHWLILQAKLISHRIDM